MILPRKVINLLFALLGTTLVSVIVRFGSRAKAEQRIGGWSPLDIS